MSLKIYGQPPKQTAGVLLVMITVVALFLIFGTVLFFVGLENSDETSMTILISIFFLIWVIACIGLIVHYFKLYRMIKEGKIDIGELEGSLKENNIETRLKELEKLKKESLISEEEYIAKRKEIMSEKW